MDIDNGREDDVNQWLDRHEGLNFGWEGVNVSRIEDNDEFLKTEKYASSQRGKDDLVRVVLYLCDFIVGLIIFCFESNWGATGDVNDEVKRTGRTLVWGVFLVKMSVRSETETKSTKKVGRETGGSGGFDENRSGDFWKYNVLGCQVGVQRRMSLKDVVNK